MERSSKALIILPILSGIFWGSAGLFVRTLTDEGFSNGTMIFVRSFFGSIILFIAIFIYNRNLLKIKLKDLWLFLGTGGVGMLGVCITYNLSMLMQSLSVAVVLLSLSPVFVMIFAAILFKEEITSRKLICMAAAVLGIMMSGGLIGGSGNTITVSGLLMGLASALFYGLYTIFSRLASERGYHTYTILFYSVFITMIASLPFATLGTVGTYISP